jgi:hypothetical protein
MGALAVIRFLLKALNLSMLFLGVGLLSYSAVMWEQYSDGAGAPPPGPSPAPPPAPAPAPPLPPPPLALGAAASQHDAPWCARGAARAARRATHTRLMRVAGVRTCRASRRFIYAAASTGLLLASTAVTGMAGATADSPRCCLTVHTAQMMLLLALQARAGVALLACGCAARRLPLSRFQKARAHACLSPRLPLPSATHAQTALLIALCVAPSLPHLPPDASGHEASLAAFVRAHLPRVRALLAASLALNATSLLLAGVLAALARAGDDDSDDEEDGLVSSPRRARRRINLSGEERLALGGGTVTERLLAPPEAAAGGLPSYTQRMCVRFCCVARGQPPFARVRETAQLTLPPACVLCAGASATRAETRRPCAAALRGRGG